VGRLFKAKAAIPAWTSTWLIQVDEDLGMSKGATSTITNGLPSMNDPDGFCIYHLHSAQWLRLQMHGRLFKPWAFSGNRARTLAG